MIYGEFPTSNLKEIVKDNLNVNTIRRMNALLRILASSRISTTNMCGLIEKHISTTCNGGKVKIGDVEKTIKNPKRSERVPVNYLADDLSQTTLSHLRWMLQKDKMGQDVFLIGRPGPARRHLALSYLQLTQKEIEFVSLSRDTTESDLKQRREIINGSAEYINQSAVRAAIEGCTLILEGIEKAERNVLPVLNNLLENREMHLEDGRFLINPNHYDKLLKEHGQEYMDKWNLIRVSDDFRVIALGLPVPGYFGNPLDPPLRSRFQARDIPPPSFQDAKNELSSNDSNAKFHQVLSFAYALLTPQSRSLSLPDFPLSNLAYLANLSELYGSLEYSEAICWLYPYKSMLGQDGRRLVTDVLSSFGISMKNDGYQSRISGKQNIDNQSCVLFINNNPIEVKRGRSPDIEHSKFVEITYHNHFISQMVLTHAVADFCIIGPSGSGKSTIVNEFARILNYSIEPIVLYQDMTSRDLIQQRSTLPDGNTVWQNCPLISAALNGKLAVLDGIDRVHSSTLSVLHRLIHDRELDLYNGQRLLRHDRYDALLSTYGADYLEKSGILRIHPSFRIVALAESPGGLTPQWLTPEVLSTFLFHELRSLNEKEQLLLLKAMFGKIDKVTEMVVKVANKLRASKEGTLSSLADCLSTRQLIRIAKRFRTFGKEDPYEAIYQACFAKFLPTLTREALNAVLRSEGIKPLKMSSFNKQKELVITHNKVQIGKTIVDRYKTDATSKVPDILFYHLPQHTDLLEELLQDFSMGEHLLLVGNQGVGKNKLADRLLQILNRPREYIQLHRDTTVQSLTIQATVIDGVVRYDDSPLVKAAQLGHVLVIDEADKAPTHVTCILKTLVESGEMILSDGRRIIPANAVSEEPNIIKTHRDFRIIILANRPGFPFLGNNLFAALGDLFSCHIVDNPSTESEKQLLQKYGPDVPENIIDNVVDAFGELRDLADQGIVSYPYSTREAVNIIKHLQEFPNDTLAEAFSNVFDFDRYSKEVRDILQKVLFSHGIPMELMGYKKNQGRNLQLTVERESGLDVSEPKHGKVDEKNEPHVGGNTWAGGTGGRDTAGLGGKGGPYRLDAGHKVHQVSDEEKDAVPEHVKKAAKEMAEKAFKERLKEIKMSAYDAKLYSQFSDSVQKQVQALRILLGNLQAKSKERQWLRHQTSGDLDDAKLIEGIIGEKAVYRRRGEWEPEIGAPQVKPKRVRLLVDVSGSMYRFNGYDGRLEREMEAVVMVMEAFSGHEGKIAYDLVGHSGEESHIVFSSVSHPPVDNKQRLEIIKTMHAHSQFCLSGDNTLEAIKKSMEELSRETDLYDESIIIVLSDANLTRYNIPARSLANVLLSNTCVGAYAIFIGSLGEQAEKLTRALPAGRGFVCMNLETIPQIIQQIFTSSLLAVE